MVKGTYTPNLAHLALAMSILREKLLKRGVTVGHLGFQATVIYFLIYLPMSAFRASNCTRMADGKRIARKMRFLALIRSIGRPPSWNNGRLHTNSRWAHIQF